MAITTPGAILIKNILPAGARDKFDLHRPLDKGGVKDLVQNLIENGGHEGPETINQLSKLFFEKATEIGATTPLADYINDDTERATMLAEFEHRVAEVMKKNIPKQEQYKSISKIAAEYRGILEKKNLQHMLERGSTAAKMAKTGARGNPQQLSWGTSSPLMSSDINGNPVPVAIKHSFAEGLTCSEHLAMSLGARASTVMTQLSTEKPGALFKRLTPTLFHEVITETDCGTKNGIVRKTTDIGAVLGRYEAGTNRLIDEHYFSELKRDKETVKVRSPMTCEAKEGLCQKCYGLAANGKLPEIGFNAGVVASQSASESITQAMLSTKHTGGVAGSNRNPYYDAANLLNNPSDNFLDEATLSTVNGKISHISKNSLGDYEVTIADKKHFVPGILGPKLEVGAEVKIGDQVSHGVINPRKLVALKGAGAGRRYLADKLRETYSRATSLDPKHFEIIAKNLIKHVEITDPGESEFLPGDKVEVGQIHQYLSANSRDVPLSEAVDKTLASNVMEMTPGTVLTKNHIDELKAHGITHVRISESGLKIAPLVPGLQSSKLLDKNWVSKLSFSRLQNTILEAAALGQKSPVHSTEPVTSYMLGTEFGKGENGKY